MPNIYIQTRMRKMPECCKDCSQMSYLNVAYTPVCRAGIQETYKLLNELVYDKERPAWCPLVGIAEHRGGEKGD